MSESATLSRDASVIAPRGAAATPDGRRVRVCIVAPSLDILGGQAIQAQRLMERLRASSEVEIGFIAVNPRLPGVLRHLQRVKYLRTVVTSIAYVASLLRNVRRYDVVHAFSASYWSFLLAPVPAMLAGRLFGKAVVLNYRSGEAEDHLAHWPISRRLVRLAHRVVVPSGYLVDVFAKHGVAAHSIENFVEIERLPWRDRVPLRPRFLSNRNFEPLYNVGCTLRAFGMVQRRFPDADLVVAGDGSQRGALERLAGDLSLRNVHFIGRVKPAEMPALYAAADIYVNSPDIDNMPSSVVEAFAAGTPVVTTNAGGIPYIVKQERTGLLVDRNDHEALARAAMRLLDEPALARDIAIAARAECEAKYVWKAAGPRWVSLYRELAPTSVHA